MAETIIYEKQGNIVTMTLNRPDSLNAINRLLRQEFSDAILQFDSDPEAYVAIITGAGRAFCSGRDLKERAEDNAQGIQATASASMTKESPFMWPRTWKPMIAAVNGFALFLVSNQDLQDFPFRSYQNWLRRLFTRNRAISSP